ncbi:carboxypeptidase regulatory-like domain-containing protein [Cyclonatronum proteinivorum]|uniref:carboxypeptidase regulatory-like domain-containing protein n=1 Tax=Cyclonatronum proteinivorum TaxID=1457365 RepID=UPI0013E087AA|nr:carboxypeptidase regulatory-like domain-containing protein [Cyclonatronum proteinivorum]
MVYSNQVMIIVEAQEAPFVIGPRGVIDDPTPVFEWEEVPGVIGYWIIFSSTPFQITTDDDGDVSVEGVTLLWSHYTTDNTATYGDVNEDGDEVFDAPPLNSGQEYSYTILNMYSESNPAFASSVFGGVTPVTFFDPEAIDPPQLTSPANNEVFIAEPELTFQWTEVDEATNYTINLYQEVTQQGVDAVLLSWSTTTTNTQITYPALGNLQSAEYQWEVIANTEFGSGRYSQRRSFVYDADTGEFRATLSNAETGDSEAGAQLFATAINEGATPLYPFFLQGTNITENLLAGTYEFKVVKEGFADKILTRTINPGQRTDMAFQLEPLPAFISGIVEDETGIPVSNARVRLRNLETQDNTITFSDSDGAFGLSVPSGSFELRVSRSGYASPPNLFLNLDLDEQLELSEPVVLTNDVAEVSGFVRSPGNIPIGLVRVRAQQGESVIETNTNSQGFYSLTLTSGNWEVRATRSGFVPSDVQQLSLGVGDVVQNNNFTLSGGANQISGFVRRVVTAADGSTSLVPAGNTRVLAQPSSGSTIETTTNPAGQFTLNLSSGSFQLLAQRPNFTLQNPLNLTLGFNETLSGLELIINPNDSEISGLVQRPDGSPLSGATVKAGELATATTSAAGAFTLSLPPGSFQLEASRSGFFSDGPQQVSLEAGQQLSGISFVMTPNAATVSGQVLTFGQPVPNTLITAVGTGGTFTTTASGNGTYSLNVSPGSYTLSAQRSGFLPPSTIELTLSAGQQTSGRNFSLIPNTRVVSGVVSSPQGAVSNAQVLVTSPDDPSFSQTTQTQVSGAYAFTLEVNKSYLITVTRTGFTSGTAEVENLSPDPQPLNRNIQINPVPAQISGLVQNDAGNAVSGALVEIFNSEGELIQTRQTESNGTYNAGLSAGTYTLQASRPGHISEVINDIILSNGQNLTGVNFEIARNFALLAGQVISAAGEPVEGALVNITRQGGGSGATRTTDAGGNFTVSTLVTGLYSISISREGFDPLTITDFEAEEGQQIAETFTLIPQTGSISGFVTNQDGVLLADATVFLTRTTTGQVRTRTTNQQGEFSFIPAAFDTYVMNASLNGYSASENLSFTLEPDDPDLTGLEITGLQLNSGVVQGVITNQQTGAGLRQVNISVDGPAGSGSAVTNVNGVYQIENLTAGTYVLQATRSGYSSFTQELTITDEEPNVVVNGALSLNDGTIQGIVTNQLNESIGQPIPVRIFTDELVYNTNTNSEGQFSVAGIQPGETYTIQTNATQQGFINGSTTLFYPFDQTVVTLDEPLVIQVNNSRIQGTAGTDAVTVRLFSIDNGEQQLIDSRVSEPDGFFRFRFLPAGDYLVQPVKAGFVFNPVQAEVNNLAFGQTAELNFTATPNVGTITAAAVTTAGEPVGGTVFTAVSDDESFVFNRTAGESGTVTFSDIPAGRTYTVTASREGFLAPPQDVTLNIGAEVSLSFEMQQALSSVSGRVSRSDTGNALSDARVRLRNLATGQQREFTTGNNGNYSFATLSAGSYRLIATRVGYIADTLLVDVPFNQQVTDQNFSLQPSQLNFLQGFVFYRGDGVEGVQVEITGDNTFDLVTNAAGRYRQAPFPIRSGAQDTTLAVISVNTGQFSASQTLRIPQSAAGSSITVPEFILPSGAVRANVTDGVAPVADLIILFNRAGGSTVTEYRTDQNGTFQTPFTLRGGTYNLRVVTERFMVPVQSYTATLESDTSSVEVDIELPFTFSPPNEIAAGQEATFRIEFTEGYEPEGLTGRLFYRLESQSTFRQEPFSAQLVGNGIEAVLPPLLSLEDVIFFTEVSDAKTSRTFRSPEFVKSPLATDLLSQIRLEPDISEIRIRTSDTYRVRLDIRDGENNSMLGRFTGEDADGTVTVELNGNDITQSLSDGLFEFDSSTAAGVANLNITATLGEQIQASAFNLMVTDEPVSSLSVSRPAPQISNRNTRTFTYSAQTSDGQPILLGTDLTWSLSNANSGVISPTGRFTPDPEVIAEFRAIATDQQTGIEAVSRTVSVFGEIRVGNEYFFTDGSQMLLYLPEEAITDNAQVSLRITRPETPKKFVVAFGTDLSLTASDEVYRLRYTGPSLNPGAELSLPLPESLRLFEGERHIGRFNNDELQWQLFETSESGSLLHIRDFSRLGQFTVLAENEPLSLQRIGILPNPFSPYIEPGARIGYFLTSDAPPAIVNITIYNMRGQLVRRLLRDSEQMPGRYGSASSPLEITWDGLTDDGRMANNGRYIMRIHVRDGRNQVTKIEQIVLVK